MATLGNFVPGVLTAAELNAIGVWSSFVPSWTNLTVGNGVAVGRVCVINRVVHYNVELTIGSTTSITGNVSVQSAPGLPPVRVTSLCATYEDAGTRYWPGSAVNIAALTLFALAHPDSANQGLVNATAPFTWAAGDDLVISGTYVY